jgi:hypothetical protein
MCPVAHASWSWPRPAYFDQDFKQTRLDAAHRQSPQAIVDRRGRAISLPTTDLQDIRSPNDGAPVILRPATKLAAETRLPPMCDRSPRIQSQSSTLPPIRPELWTLSAVDWIVEFGASAPIGSHSFDLFREKARSKPPSTLSGRTRSSWYRTRSTQEEKTTPSRSRGLNSADETPSASSLFRRQQNRTEHLNAYQNVTTRPESQD